MGIPSKMLVCYERGGTIVKAIPCYTFGFALKWRKAPEENFVVHVKGTLYASISLLEIVRNIMPTPPQGIRTLPFIHTL
jgi:hypothetical protein